MANDITTFGYRGFEASFGIDNSSVSRTIYLKDDTNLDDILKKLLGDGTATPFKPHECPERPGFYCTEVRVSPIDSKSCQGSINDNDYDTFLDTPIIFRGLELECTYTPIDTMWGVSEEVWDFSAQTMSLVGNVPASGKPCLVWEDGAKEVTNLPAVVKIIPKIELLQKRIYVSEVGSDTLAPLIGSVNDADFLFMSAAANGDQAQWPIETVLFTGMPLVRKFRWDATSQYELGIKLAVNTLYDIVETGEYDYVGWNRLYRAETGRWEYVNLGVDGPRLYTQEDFSPLNDTIDKPNLT